MEQLGIYAPVVILLPFFIITAVLFFLLVEGELEEDKQKQKLTSKKHL
jgi:hypothetical protein